MSTKFQFPSFTCQWQSYLKYPWRLRWKWLPLSIHFGRDFRRFYADAGSSWRWSREQIEAYQWAKIQSLIQHAYRTVPFYRELWTKYRIRPDQIKSLQDYASLPVVTRSDIIDNLDSFRSSEWGLHRGYSTETSGTTGAPLSFYRTPLLESARLAMQWRHFNQIGYKFKQPRVSLSATFTGSEGDLLYRFDALENHVAFNGRFLTLETVGAICDVVRKFQPVMFYGHPSALLTLAGLMSRLDLSPLNVPVVFLYSEIVTEGIRRRISDRIGRRIFDYYGNRENTVSAAQFPCGEYHVNSEFVYLELIESGDTFTGEKLYRVISTNLFNYAMPFLRYDSDDLAVSLGPCPACDIAHPTIKFVGGRVKNFLVSRHGLLHCQFDDFLHEDHYDRLEDFQIVQQDIDHLILKLVPARSFQKEADEKKMIELLRSSTHNWFEIEVKYVNQIPTTKGFKKVKVLSALAESEFANGIRPAGQLR